MRRQRVRWEYLVIAILLTVYGAFFASTQYGKNQGLFVSAIVALSIGATMLLVYSILYAIGQQKAKRLAKQQKPEVHEEPEYREEVEKPKEEPKREPRPTSYARYETPTYPSRPSRSRYDSETCYVREVGIGPILEINGNRIRDMRNNEYYRLEGNDVFHNGSGLAYHISGNQIRTIHGGMLFEKSGDRINKVFGGFYASISGNRMTKYDLSRILEISGPLSDKMILVVTVLGLGEK